MLISVVLESHNDPRWEPAFFPSWLRQSCPGDAYEIVVVGLTSDRDLQPRYAPLLRPQDRLIQVEQGGPCDLIHAGALVANGEWLFTTEDHCEALPDCLSHARSFIETTTADGAFIGSGHINRTWVGRLEQATYENDFPHWTQFEWNRVHLRGMVVRRQAYLSVDHPQQRYGLFSTTALAIALNRSGYRLGFIPHVGVKHSNCHTLKHFSKDIREFVRGECMYRQDHDFGQWETYLDLPTEWREGHGYNRARACAATVSIVRTLPGCLRFACEHPTRSVIGSLAAEAARRLPDAIIGPSPRRLLARLRLGMTGLRCWARLGRESRRARAWMRANVRLARVEYAVDRLALQQDDDFPAATDLCMTEVSDAQRTGFHRLEQFDGKGFRWSTPVASVRLKMPPGDYAGEIETIGARPLSGLPVGIFFNGHRVTARRVQSPGDSISFLIARTWFEPAGTQELMIVCPRLRRGPRAHRDKRRLGLPVHAIRFGPAHAPGE